MNKHIFPFMMFLTNLNSRTESGDGDLGNLRFLLIAVLLIVAVLGTVSSRR